MPHLTMRFPYLMIAALFALAACENAPWREEPPQPMAAMPMNIEAGETVEVQPGDTVYSVARRYKVPMNDIITLNQLRAPFSLRSGSTITLPTKPIMTAAPIRRPPPAPVQDNRAVSILTPADERPAPKPNGVITHHQEASRQQLIDNGMEKDVVLYAPSNQSAMASLAADSAKHPAEGADTRPEPLVKDVVPPPVPQVKPKLKPPEFKDGPARPVAGRFIWPVHGSITSNFGGKAGDMRNDGLNIAAPFGTPVAASDGGTVAYAGSEIPGYGNVVLIRHPDGYMTTYAHLERIMVDRDSIAAKGDIIGTVGTTGGLASPQLHFEIRKGAEALDPKKFMLNQ